jgi:Leucine-rich repeat (LRR) protein
LEIISVDPKVEVQLLRNGEPVKLINPEKEPNLNLDAGEYDVRLKKGTKGLKVEPDHISVRHDAKAVVRISRGYASDLEWVKQVSALPPEQQLKAVLAKLKEENPDFDGAAVDKTVDPDGVTVLTLRTDKVQDISPVRALEKLKTLGFMGTAGMLEDLSPLKGLKLESLDCGANKIKDLSPLKGMPLKLLLLGENPVTDLTPLKDLPLENLEIKNLDKVSNLAVLKSIKTLKTLNFKRAEAVLKQLETKAGENSK